MSVHHSAFNGHLFWVTYDGLIDVLLLTIMAGIAERFDTNTSSISESHITWFTSSFQKIDKMENFLAFFN